VFIVTKQLLVCSTNYSSILKDLQVFIVTNQLRVILYLSNVFYKYVSYIINI